MTKFAVPNKRITNDLIDELSIQLSQMTLERASKIMSALGYDKLKCFTQKGSLSISEIANYYGPSTYADSIYPVQFFGGPEREGAYDERFVYIAEATVFDWVMDSILFRMTEYEVEDVLSWIGVY